MTPIEQYKQNDKLRLLLQGPSGTGKTTLACQFPGAYVVDVDRNLGGPLRFLKNHDMKLPVGFDVLDIDESGNEVPMKFRYSRLDKLLLDAQQRQEVETIVLDSGTTLSDVLIGEVLRQQNKNAITDWKDQRQFWNFFAGVGRKFMGTLAQMRKHIVLIVHERLNTTESGAVVYPVKVAWPGQVGQNIGAFFTNVWRAEVMIVPKALETTYRWQIRTKPDGKYELKDSLELPPLFEFNWKTIEDRLK